MEKVKNLRIRGAMIVACLLSSLGAHAGDVGISAFTSTSNSLWNYVPSVQLLVYAIAGIVAVVGAISVYIKMNNEEQDVKKSIMMIVGSCIFLVSAATGLPKFFGYNGQGGVISSTSGSGLTRLSTDLTGWGHFRNSVPVEDETGWARQDPYLAGEKWKPGFNGSIL